MIVLCANYLIAIDIPKKDIVKNNSEILNQKLESFLQAGQTGFELNEGPLPKEI